jgi:hypothetical protein
MFFCYPVAAIAENWISTAILTAVIEALDALKQGREVVDFLAAVPEAYRAEFERGTKFPTLFSEFVAACSALGPPQLDIVLNAVAAQNNFPHIFDVVTPCPSIAAEFPDVHQSARRLFDYAFSKLSDLKTPGSDLTIRENYHKIVHEHFESGCCPFCGLEILEAPDPDLVDPDLDHFLAASRYPFAGANLRNLTAMGTTCNRSYKGAADVLLDEQDIKVDCLDPYGNEQVSVDLMGTIVLPGAGLGPAWRLTFAPDQKSRNLRRILSIEGRIKVNVLEKHYQRWVKEMRVYAQKNSIDLSSKQGALKAVTAFKDTCEFETLPTVRKLKYDFFTLIELDLANVNRSERTHNFLVALTREKP